MGSLNVGTMTGKGRELADLMERKKINMFCVQATKWWGIKARMIVVGCKLFYHWEDGRRNGTGVVVKEKSINNVLEVKRVTDSNESKVGNLRHSNEYHQHIRAEKMWRILYTAYPKTKGLLLEQTSMDI